MATDKDGKQESTAAGSRTAVGVRLIDSPTGQPVLANYASASPANGLVLIDFGFLEPAMLNALAKAAKSGGKVPKAVQGNLGARVALTPEAARALMQQLGRMMAPSTAGKKTIN